MDCNHRVVLPLLNIPRLKDLPRFHGHIKCGSNEYDLFPSRDPACRNVYPIVVSTFNKHTFSRASQLFYDVLIRMHPIVKFFDHNRQGWRPGAKNVSVGADIRIARNESKARIDCPII